MRHLILVFLILFSGTIHAQDLLKTAKTAKPESYNFVEQQKAQIFPTSDNKSFLVFWTPPGKAATDLPTIVSLHGHASWTFEDFRIWQPYALKHGYNIVSLQWWFGKGEKFGDYYTPKEIYPLISSFLQKNHLTEKKILLHGYSRGSSNVYALAALDKFAKNGFFSMVLANAGGAMQDYPPNKEINSGRFGKNIFSGTKWILFCGGLDPQPERSGCAGMQRTESWIKSLGGEIKLFIKDENSGHGGFHLNSANTEAALQAFDQL